MFVSKNSGQSCYTISDACKLMSNPHLRSKTAVKNILKYSGILNGRLPTPRYVSKRYVDFGVTDARTGEYHDFVLTEKGLQLLNTIGNIIKSADGEIHLTLADIVQVAKRGQNEQKR